MIIFQAIQWLETYKAKMMACNPFNLRELTYRKFDNCAAQKKMHEWIVKMKLYNSVIQQNEIHQNNSAAKTILQGMHSKNKLHGLAICNILSKT